jgi:hypothetical protein
MIDGEKPNEVYDLDNKEHLQALNGKIIAL